MDGEQKNPQDLTINNITIMSNPKPETRHSNSVATSVASSSLDKITDLNKNNILQLEINKEIDKLFGPALERTRSGSDIEVTPPLRQKRRQYHSQEVLSPDISLTETQGSLSSYAGLNIFHKKEPKDIMDDKLKQVAILYDNQRAEIVASVTERLYNRLKRNEKVVSKMESMVDKKIMQPLSELKICSNARQRLIELSQKAIKNKRKIGIPAYAQTKKYATRVKDQEIDIQTDLFPYANYHQNNIETLQKDVSTETEVVTPRYKDVAIGSKSGTLKLIDQSTSTTIKRKKLKNAFTMTDTFIMCDRSTQTNVIPPPRRKKRSSVFSRYLKKSECLRSRINDKTSSSIININITPGYSVDTESASGSSDICETNLIPSAPSDITKATETVKKNISQLQNKTKDFSDDEEFSVLPRMALDPNRKIGCKDYEDMILGREGYPYNIIISPYKDIEDKKRVIQFKDIDVTPEECGSAKWLEKKHESLDFSDNRDLCDFKLSGSMSIDTAELTRIELKSLHNTSYNNKVNGEQPNTRSITLRNNNGDYTNGNIKSSLSETEITESCVKSTSPSLSNSSLLKIKNHLESRSRSLHMLIDNRRFREATCITNRIKYQNQVRLTPTEYLKQLIHIRRETVASNYS